MEARPKISGHDDGRMPELLKRGHPGPGVVLGGRWSSQGKVKKKGCKVNR
jgi:hypothetical protein